MKPSLITVASSILSSQQLWDVLSCPALKGSASCGILGKFPRLLGLRSFNLKLGMKIVPILWGGGEG